MNCKTCHHEHEADANSGPDDRGYSDPMFCIARLSSMLDAMTDESERPKAESNPPKCNCPQHLGIHNLDCPVVQAKLNAFYKAEDIEEQSKTMSQGERDSLGGFMPSCNNCLDRKEDSPPCIPCEIALAENMQKETIIRLLAESSCQVCVHEGCLKVRSLIEKIREKV